MCAGGQAYSIISILDTMEVIKPDIATIAFGQCASTATLLLVRARCGAPWPSCACTGTVQGKKSVMTSEVSYGESAQAAGTKGKRFSMPNSRIMMHQPAGAARLFFSRDAVGLKSLCLT